MKRAYHSTMSELLYISFTRAQGAFSEGNISSPEMLALSGVEWGMLRKQEFDCYADLAFFHRPRDRAREPSIDDGLHEYGIVSVKLTFKTEAVFSVVASGDLRIPWLTRYVGSFPGAKLHPERRRGSISGAAPIFTACVQPPQSSEPSINIGTAPSFRLPLHLPPPTSSAALHRRSFADQCHCKIFFNACSVITEGRLTPES